MPRSDHPFYLTIANSKARQLRTLFAIAKMRIAGLFPFTLSDVHSRCTCPDKANPCKHIAAVYYQLGTRFSEDPFVIFQLRGRTREQILERLREIRI